jgi:hypothetical protein
MRSLLMLIALAAAGAAAHQGLLARNSYSGYSDAHLEQLQEQLSDILSRGDDPEDHHFSLQLLRTEQRRRLRFRLALGTAGFAALATLATSLFSGHRERSLPFS